MRFLVPRENIWLFYFYSTPGYQIRKDLVFSLFIVVIQLALLLSFWLNFRDSKISQKQQSFVMKIKLCAILVG